MKLRAREKDIEGGVVSFYPLSSVSENGDLLLAEVQAVAKLTDTLTP
jgi:hypothetical protein